MNATQEIERSETRADGLTYTLEAYASLWVAYRLEKRAGRIPLCAPSSYEFAHERFVAGKRTNEQ